MLDTYLYMMYIYQIVRNIFSKISKIKKCFKYKNYFKIIFKNSCFLFFLFSTIKRLLASVTYRCITYQFLLRPYKCKRKKKERKKKELVPTQGFFRDNILHLRGNTRVSCYVINVKHPGIRVENTYIPECTVPYLSQFSQWRND